MKTENVAELAKRQGLNRFTAYFLVFLHVGAVAALFMFSWKALAVAAVLYYITIGLGISMGYHRLHTHRSYKVPLLARICLRHFAARMTLEGGPIFWVATHRMHHQISDQPGDPHSPRDGAFWSHMGWILLGRQPITATPRCCAKYAPDLAKHRFYVWLNNYHWVPIVDAGRRSVRLGRAPDVPVGHLPAHRVRPARHLGGELGDAHVGHAAASTPATIRATPGGSRIITFGEGWHNNHHAHPTSARHGLAWYEFDLELAADQGSEGLRRRQGDQGGHR